MSEVKMKGIMKVFEVGDHWPPSVDGDSPFLGGEHYLGDVAPPWVWADLLKKHWSPTTEGGNWVKNFNENVTLSLFQNW